MRKAVPTWSWIGQSDFQCRQFSWPYVFLVVFCLDISSLAWKINKTQTKGFFFFFVSLSWIWTNCQLCQLLFVVTIVEPLEMHFDCILWDSLHRIHTRHRSSLLSRSSVRTHCQPDTLLRRPSAGPIKKRGRQRTNESHLPSEQRHAFRCTTDTLGHAHYTLTHSCAFTVLRKTVSQSSNRFSSCSVKLPFYLYLVPANKAFPVSNTDNNHGVKMDKCLQPNSFFYF